MLIKLHSLFLSNHNLPVHFPHKYPVPSVPAKEKYSKVQIQSICRRHFKCSSNDDLCFSLHRKHCGKRRKCWLPAFSPLPSLFSKGFFPRVVKSGLCGKELNHIFQSTTHSLTYCPVLGQLLHRFCLDSIVI